MSRKRPQPSDVFTPRSPEVNRDMYVSRNDLERKLRRAVNGTQHLIVFGDSGSGKTWLYKEYFRKEDIPYVTVDLSVALTEGLSAALARALPASEWRAIRRTISGATDANFYVVKAGGEVEVEYEKTEQSPLDAILSHLGENRARKRFIVFDNFEQVSTSPGLLREIASLIIRLDSDNFARHGVRFLFVGVVADMKELIAHYDQAGTVANRIVEIPEVERLTPDEAFALVQRGLFEKLEIETEPERERLIERILFLSDRNAQQLHELCYEIACEAEENKWKLTTEGLARAENDWVETSLSIYRAQIEARMNKKETKIQRRNQVLFCIGAAGGNRIKASEIDAMVRELFPDRAGVDQLGVDQILAGLADGKNPILIRNPNEPTYRLAHPKLRLAIRVRLEQFAPSPKKDALDVEADTGFSFHNFIRSVIDRDIQKNEVGKEQINFPRRDTSKG